MELRARTRPMLRRAGVLAALTALLVPTAVGTATADAAKRKKKRTPVVTSIAPSQAFVGDTLTIRGRHFRPGLNKNTVAFKRPGAKVVFVKAEKGTRKLLRVELPKRLESIMAVQNGTPVPTRMQVRVLAARFGKRFTALSKSPVIGPQRPPAPPQAPAAAPDGDCDGDGQVNRVDGDDDNDGLGDGLETALKLDPCGSDTDRDGIEDGFEQASAQDLNNDEYSSTGGNVPYPHKRPYPNALDGTDANTDHDGDSLTLREEQELWRFTGDRNLAALTYSAGKQYSVSTRSGGRTHPALPAAGYTKQAEFRAWAGAAGYLTVHLSYPGNVFGDVGEQWWEPRTARHVLDLDRSGAVEADEDGYYAKAAYLNDAQRDEDADGLPNQWELTGCMTPNFWKELYDKEVPFPLTYAAPSAVDADSDGDGVRDGADDQDNDDVPNVMECSRALAQNGTPQSAQGAVQPFNPCMPHRRARACTPYVSIKAPWAPFNIDEYEIKN